MTETTKTIFEKYRIRKTKKQKTEFIGFAKEKAVSLGYECNVENGSFGARNIVIGDPEKAKVVYTAHYDTCPRLPFPNFITPKNFLIYLLYQLIIVAAIFIPIFAVSFGLGFLAAVLDAQDLIMSLYFPIYYGMLIGILALIFAGPANKNTANDNTSGVTTLFSIMEALPNELKGSVAFIFFDLEEMGLLGSSSYVSKHKNAKKDALVINFDCVSDGENILFVLKKGSAGYEGALKNAFASDDSEKFNVMIEKKGVFYPSDQAVFNRGVGVAALKRSKSFGVLYMDRIHTKKDVIYREENIEFLTDGSIKLVKELSNGE